MHLLRRDRHVACNSPDVTVTQHATAALDVPPRAATRLPPRAPPLVSARPPLPAQVALAAAEAAIRINPSWSLAWVRRVRALRLLRRFAEAAMCCNALASAQLPGAAALEKEKKMAMESLVELQAHA